MTKLAAATGRSRLHSLALSDINSGLVVDGGGSHAFLDLAGHGQKGLFDIGGVLCGGLKERDSKAIGEFLLPYEYRPGRTNSSRRWVTDLGHGIFNHLLIRHIALVANK